MIATRELERRCRRFLAQRGVCVHKVKGNKEPVYYLYESDGDDSVPEEEHRFLSLFDLNDYCGELLERDN